MISISSFSWCTGHQGCELSPRFKWKSGMAMSWTSMKLFSGWTPKSAVNFSVFTHCQVAIQCRTPFYGRGTKSALKLLEIDMLLWKAADQRGPPEEARNFANFGWNIEGSAITTAVSTAPVAPQALLDAVSCSCTAGCKACSGTRCSCNSSGVSCTDKCKCEWGDICCSPFISKQLDIEDDEG